MQGRLIGPYHKQMAAKGEKGFQMLVMGICLMGGYAIWRGRTRYDVLSDKYEFEKSSATRHLVPLEQRVDQEALARWLAEQEKSEAASSTPASNDPSVTDGAKKIE